MSKFVRPVLVMAACTAIGTLLINQLSVTDIAMLYLIGVGIVAARATRRQAAVTAVLSVALFDFFFIPPRFTFTVEEQHYLVTFLVMLATALVISWLAEQVREGAVAARAREQGTAALSPMSGELLAAWAFQAWEPAGLGTSHVPETPIIYLPLVGTHGRLGVLEGRPADPARFRDPAVRWLLQTFAAQAGLALERVTLAAS